MKEHTRYVFGEWLNSETPLNKSEAEHIIKIARKQVSIFRDYSLEKTFNILEKVRKAWSDPSFSYRKKAEKLLKAATYYSDEMIQLSMNELSVILNTDLLRRKLNTELRGLSNSSFGIYDYFSNTLMRWEPLGVLLHVISGNVFLVGIASIIEAWISGNISIVKMPSSETSFLPVFIKSVIENDSDGILSRTVALIEYPSNEKELISVFKKNVDGIVVWGGEEAVKAYRENLKAKTRLIIFGPKISISVITQKAMNTSLPNKLSSDIAVWDQNACSSPQMAFVERWDNCKSFARSLAFELEKISNSSPSVDINVAAEIQKFRSVYEMREARNEAVIYYSNNNVSWTVVADKNNVIEPSPLHRTIRIVPFENLSEIEARLQEWRGYIQTIGLAADDSEVEHCFSTFTRAGALRIMSLGHMAESEIDDPHDGLCELPQFGNLVYIRNRSIKSHPIDFVSQEKRLEIINNDLLRLIREARKSPFYEKRIGEVNSIDDLEKIPILTRTEMEKNMPPFGSDLGTKIPVGGYVSRSGGSTGEPKFSIYDKEDWQNLIEHATRVFIALGLKPYDKVANLLLAGNLYGSFVSFDHVNAKLGVTSFAFTGNADTEFFIKVYKNFGIDVIEGVPAYTMKLMKEAKEIYPALRIERIIYGGAPMSLADKTWLKENIGAKRISSLIGANDGGQFAFQCECLSGNIHHTCDDFNYVEIVDEYGKKVRDGEEGRILITSLKKYAFPLIRYDIGDWGRIVKEKCDCGRTNRLIEYLGRHDYLIAVGTINLNYNDIFNAFEQFNFSDLQVVVRSSDKGDEVILKIEGDENIETLKNAIFKKVPKLHECLMTRSISDIKIELYKPNTLPRNPVSGKLKKIIDERFSNKKS